MVPVTRSPRVAVAAAVVAVALARRPALLARPRLDLVGRQLRGPGLLARQAAAAASLGRGAVATGGPT